MIRQGVGGFPAIGGGASNHWRAIGTQNRSPPLLMRADKGTLFTN